MKEPECVELPYYIHHFSDFLLLLKPGSHIGRENMEDGTFHALLEMLACARDHELNSVSNEQLRLWNLCKHLGYLIISQWIDALHVVAEDLDPWLHVLFDEFLLWRDVVKNFLHHLVGDVELGLVLSALTTTTSYSIENTEALIRLFASIWLLSSLFNKNVSFVTL